MNKELLNKDKIEQDIRGSATKDIVSNLGGLFLCFLFSVLLLFLATLAQNFKNIASMVLMAAIFLVYALGLAGNVYFKYKDICAVKLDKVYITVDLLTDMKEKSNSMYFHTSRPYILIFDTYGEYNVPAQNYTYSSMYKMDDAAVYIHSTIGDSFYLVIGPKNRIIRAYNKRFFIINDKN